MGGGDSLVDYSQSLCYGGCVAPYSVVIVPCLRLSDPVLLPGPGGRGAGGRLPVCGLRGLWGLSLLCVTLALGTGMGWAREADWLLTLPSARVSLSILSHLWGEM